MLIFFNRFATVSQCYITDENLYMFNPLGSTNADTCFVASSPDNAEKNLHYTFSFDRTDKSNTSIEFVKGLLLSVYTHNNNLITL